MSTKNELVEEDIYKVLKVCKAEELGNRLEKEWEKECLKEKPSLFKALCRLFALEYFIIGLNELVIKSILM